MTRVNNFIVLNIREYLKNRDKLGEDKLLHLLSEFYCPLNQDVEYFLKQQAIEFAKKHQAVTYLILSIETAELLGYFSIAIKPLAISGESFSNVIKRKFLRFGKINEDGNTYNLAVYLIAQLGKNYKNRVNERITGQELLEMAMKQMQFLQYQAGGMVVVVETNNEEKLLSFYNDYGFKQFDTRLTKSNKQETRELAQLLMIL